MDSLTAGLHTFNMVDMITASHCELAGIRGKASGRCLHILIKRAREKRAALIAVGRVMKKGSLLTSRFEVGAAHASRIRFPQAIKRRVIRYRRACRRWSRLTSSQLDHEQHPKSDRTPQAIHRPPLQCETYEAHTRT